MTELGDGPAVQSVKIGILISILLFAAVGAWYSVSATINNLNSCCCNETLTLDECPCLCMDLAVASHRCHLDCKPEEGCYC